MMATPTAIGLGILETHFGTRFLVPLPASISSASISSASMSAALRLVDELRGGYGFGFFGGTIMLCHVLPFEVKARSDSL